MGKSGSQMSVTKYSTSANAGELPLFLFRSAPKPVTTKPRSPACQIESQQKRSENKLENPSEFVCRRPHESRPATYSLMHDSRVRRGRYFMEVGTTQEFPEYPEFEMVKNDPLCQMYLKKLIKSSPTKQLSKKSKIVTVKTPTALTDFKAINERVFNVLCQTDPFIESLGIEDFKIEQGSQTEPLVNLDARKAGVAKQRTVKIGGEDKETQILPGELWNLNEAVAPIVESLAGALMEQALIELMQEEELDKITSQQKVYENVRKTELDRLRRLQERQQQIVEENAQEVQEQIKMAEQAVAIGTQISAAMFVKSYLRTVLSTTMDAARKDGILKDKQAAAKEDATSVIQWMESETKQSASMNIISRNILDDIIKNSLKKREERNEEQIESNLDNTIDNDDGDFDMENEDDDKSEYSNSDESDDVDDNYDYEDNSVRQQSL